MQWSTGKIETVIPACHEAPARRHPRLRVVPENLLITKADTVKILDFGIARMLPAEGDEATTMDVVTQTGLVLGSLGYIAPEQVTAEGTDGRADIFAFGAVLYEMLTGKRAFRGNSQAGTIQAILESPTPDPSIRNPEIPPALSHLVFHCLEKTPDLRMQSAGELVEALTAIARSTGSGRGTVTIASSETAAAEPSIAILPFLDLSPAKDHEYFCAGVAEEITNTLAQARGLRVVSRTSAFRFQGQAHDIRVIGRALGADVVLEGSLRTAANRVRIAVRLVDSRGGFQIWADRFDRDLGDVFAVQDDIALRVADALRARLVGITPTRLVPGRTSNLDAYTLFLKGRHHWNRRTEADLDVSADYFGQALEIDPSYAQAHAGLADVLTTQAIYGVKSPETLMAAAKAAALEALRIAPHLSEPHACLGCIEGLYDWAWGASVEHFQRAIAINADDPRARQWYATNCLVPLGQFHEALRELQVATALDPLSPAVSASVGITMYYARMFDEAANGLVGTLQLDERFGPAHFFLGQVHTARQAYGEARDAFEAGMRIAGRTPEMLSAFAYSAARAGDAATARGILAELTDLSLRRYVSPTAFAQVHLGLGDRAASLDDLERALEIGALDVAWIGVRPTFDALKDEPRFISMVERTGVLAIKPAARRDA
jgi:TolB-like protein/Tfp pilus assembly protein PilF